MAKASDVAEYIIRSIPTDPLKLQKLLYYTQAISLVKFNVPAFDDKIEAWDYGPVIREIYDKYKEYGYSNIPRSETKKGKLDIKIISSLDLVLEHYGPMTGSALINETHSEKPWREAYAKAQNTEITQKAIKGYYKTIYTFN